MSDIRERIWSCLERCCFFQKFEEPTKSKGSLEADPKRGNNSSSHVLLMFLDCRSLQRVYSQSLKGVIVSGDGGFPSIHWKSFMVEIQQKVR